MNENMALYKHSKEMMVSTPLISLFQPIYATNSSAVDGYQALSRAFVDSQLHSLKAT